jgi:hypothetical protein
MKNFVRIAMIMGLIGLSFEAVCQEEAAVYPAPQPEPFVQTGEGMGGGFGAGYAPGPGGTGMPGMPMALPFFEMQKKTALIVPAQPLEAEVIGQLTEDIHVMAQILYETIHPDKVHASTNKYLRWSQEMIGGFFEDADNTGVVGLYLQGYGMVFLQQVDFPLVPLEEQPAAAASSAQPADEVWQKTQRKLQGGYEPEEESEGPRYDAKRVDQLKETVLQSLKHASNIRHLIGSECVVVVVKSIPHRTGISQPFAGMVMMPGAGGGGGRMGGSVSSFGAEVPRAAAEQPSFLMVRAQKKDIDDLAAGRIGPEDFAAKVIMISY